MRVVIECYGASQRWCGAESLSLDLVEGNTARNALDALALRYPEFAARRDSVAIAIGDSIALPARLLADGDRLALIPPVSAG